MCPLAHHRPFLHLSATMPVNRSLPPSPPPVIAHPRPGKQPQAAKPAASVNVNTVRTASSAAHHHHRTDNKAPTISKASAAATGACGAVAASGLARAKANCRARAVTASGPSQTKNKAGAVSANGPPKTKVRSRTGANTKPGSKAATAPAASRTKPLPAEGRSALGTIQEGEVSGQLDQWRACIMHAFVASKWQKAVPL